MSEERLKYDDVEVVLFDPNVSMRRLIRSSLQAIGFTSVRECRNVDEMVGILSNHMVDLLIVDIDADSERACEIIQNIRHSEVGHNPFLVIIALTWHPEREVINLTLRAGTDDLVTKPVSAKVLEERVSNLIRNRREFVVTMDYVGPERRTRPKSRPMDLPTIKVPNTLRGKATGDAVEASAEIQETERAVKIHKVYRIASKLAAKAMELEGKVQKGSGMRVPHHHLTELADLAEAANRHIVAENIDYLATIGASMRSVMDGILASPAASVRQLEILRLHGHAIVASVRGDEAAAELVANALETAAYSLTSRVAARASSA